MTRFVPREAMGVLFDDYEHTAFRLETRDRYVEDSEQEPLRRFLADEPGDDAWLTGWTDDVRAAVAAGKRIERVRVVSEPHSDYARFSLDVAQLNVAAGEDIRYLPRPRAQELELPEEDFWLFDSARVAILRFADDERLLGVEVVDDPAVVVQRCRWRDAAWHYATAWADYRVAQTAS